MLVMWTDLLFPAFPFSRYPLFLEYLLDSQYAFTPILSSEICLALFEAMVDVRMHTV